MRAFRALPEGGIDDTAGVIGSEFQAMTLGNILLAASSAS